MAETLARVHTHTHTHTHTGNSIKNKKINKIKEDRSIMLVLCDTS